MVFLEMMWPMKMWCGKICHLLWQGNPSNDKNRKRSQHSQIKKEITNTYVWALVTLSSSWQCFHVLFVSSFLFLKIIYIYFIFHKSSTMRSRSDSREPLAAVCDTPRLVRRGVLGEFCFSLLGGNAFKSSRAPYAAIENSGSPVVSKSNTQDWKYTSSTCRVSLHLAVARSTV